MSSVTASPAADLSRALRSHLAAHNFQVALLSALTLLAAAALWYVLHGVVKWLVLLFTTAVAGTEARLPSALEPIFWTLAAVLVALAVIDRRLRKDDRPRDHKSAGEIAWEFLLAIPRITLAIGGTLSAWQRLSEQEIADAVALIERLVHEHRVPLTSLPVEIPDSASRFRILFALQLVQVIDIRREKGGASVSLNPLRPRALAAPLSPPGQSPACAP